jgi:hypothetical protein
MVAIAREITPPKLARTRHRLRTMLAWCGIILRDHGEGLFRRSKYAPPVIVESRAAS